MFAALLPLIARVGAGLGARAAVGMGAAEGGIGARIGANLGERTAVSAARHLSGQFNNERNNQNN